MPWRLSLPCCYSTFCSQACHFKARSDRQLGHKNSIFKIDPNRKEEIAKHISAGIRNAISTGKFTPKSNNYKCGAIPCIINGIERTYRSSWEIMFYALEENDNLEYETLRIPYNQTKTYITDFYDPSTNTIYEVKPKKYQNDLLKIKQNECLKLGYNFVIIDEDYFLRFSSDDMLNAKNKIVFDADTYDGRFSWLKSKRFQK